MLVASSTEISEYMGYSLKTGIKGTKPKKEKIKMVFLKVRRAIEAPRNLQTGLIMRLLCDRRGPLTVIK